MFHWARKACLLQQLGCTSGPLWQRIHQFIPLGGCAIMRKNSYLAFFGQKFKCVFNASLTFVSHKAKLETKVTGFRIQIRKTGQRIQHGARALAQQARSSIGAALGASDSRPPRLYGGAT